MFLTEDEKKAVTLLCFAETIISTVANAEKPKTRRHNSLLAAIDKIKRADETYKGTLPSSFQERAEQILAEVEVKIDELLST